MAKAFVFPGQGAQFVGMGKDLYDNNPLAKDLFEKANEILGYRITDIMFEGTDEELKQTKVTQPAVFLHSVLTALFATPSDNPEENKPQMMAGHSLGAPSTMAAIIGLADEKVEEICASINREGYVVIPANYNNPGQLVISGNIEAINEACAKLKEAGAKRALPLKVGGAFHSPLMQPAKDELQAAIEQTEFHEPMCPIYQNVDGRPHTQPEEIKQNLIAQLTSPVRWTQCVQSMIADGADDFTECGPGKALQGMIVKINREVNVHGV